MRKIDFIEHFEAAMVSLKNRLARMPENVEVRRLTATDRSGFIADTELPVGTARRYERRVQVNVDVRVRLDVETGEDTHGKIVTRS